MQLIYVLLQGVHRGESHQTLATAKRHCGSVLPIFLRLLSKFFPLLVTLQVPVQVVVLAEAFLTHRADVRAYILVNGCLVLLEECFIRKALSTNGTIQLLCFYLLSRCILHINNLGNLRWVDFFHLLRYSWSSRVRKFFSQCRALRHRDQFVRCCCFPLILFSMNNLVSEQTGRLTETSPAMRATVRPLVGVNAQLVPPEVGDLFEDFPAVIARFGFNRIDEHHQRGCERLVSGSVVFLSSCLVSVRL